MSKIYPFCYPVDTSASFPQAASAAKSVAEPPKRFRCLQFGAYFVIFVLYLLAGEKQYATVYGNGVEDSCQKVVMTADETPACKQNYLVQNTVCTKDPIKSAQSINSYTVTVHGRSLDGKKPPLRTTPPLTGICSSVIMK